MSLIATHMSSHEVMSSIRKPWGRDRCPDCSAFNFQSWWLEGGFWEAGLGVSWLWGHLVDDLYDIGAAFFHPYGAIVLPVDLQQQRR